MSGLLYFIEGEAHCNGGDLVERIRRAGLGYAFDEETRAVGAGAMKGPGGKPGMVVAVPAGVDRLGYYPDDQQWRNVPNLDGVHVGMVKDAPPAPADLRWPRMLDGHLVILGDHKHWLVPVARAVRDDYTEYIALPASVRLDDEGNWSRTAVESRYEHLWPLACRWWDAKMQAHEHEDDEGLATHAISVEFQDLMNAACTALGGNYRIGPAEADLLGLLTSDNAPKVLNALVDFPRVMELVKKKAQETLASRSGEATGSDIAHGETG